MEVIRVAYVEFNERLSDWPAISEVGNEAFGMWIRCLIYIAWWDTPGTVIVKEMALRFGNRGLLIKLTEVKPPYPPFLELAEGPHPELAHLRSPGVWYRPVNWEVGSTFKPAWTKKRDRIE
jgi:hypothetical protein